MRSEVRNLGGELFGFERTALAPLAVGRSMLVTNPGLFSREDSPLRKLNYYVVEIRGVSSDEVMERIYKLSLLETVTGNFNSLLSQNKSLFFLSFDGSLLRAKRGELCSMPCGVVREGGPKSQGFPVKIPVSREVDLESGSHETSPTAIDPIYIFAS
jgi:hypothetical protein